MIRRIHALTLLFLAVVSFAMTACGQMGPLTLPDESANEEEQSDEENER